MGRRASKRSRSRAGRGIATCAVLLLLVGATPSAAEEYQSTYTGHPLRILAYVVHPIGVILNVLIFRPAHWIASHEPIKKLVGQHD
jgi:hypothetical protein